MMPKPGPDDQLWLGVAASLLMVAFVLVVWRFITLIP